MRIDEIRNVLACPACRSELEWKATGPVCGKCGKHYEYRNGKVFFILPNTDKQIRNWYDKLKYHFKRYKRFYRFLMKLFAPVCSTSRRDLKRWLNDAGGKVLIDIGSGVRKIDERLIGIDIFEYAGVDIVADASVLPFKDGSVDGLVNIAVLEHVKNPETMVSEFHRVLKPGGKFFVFVPFLQGYHASPTDYFRWTEQGCGRLFSAFSRVRVHTAQGPASSLLWVFQEWFAVTFSFYSKFLYKVLLILVSLVTFPFKYLDFLLVRHPMAKNAAAGFYIFGKK